MPKPRISRKIIHLDCDCFFAAVEMRDDPKLRGIPLAVGGAREGRGVISTCNYEARLYGIHSAMPTAQALKRCPELLVLPHNMEKYKEVSRGVRTIFERYTENIEPVSIDEAYLDVTDSGLCHGSATWIAEAIRREVKSELGITVSAGIAPNKFLAKVASDWNKPDGTFTVAPDDVEEFVETLPVSKIPGVGRVMQRKLAQFRVETCADMQVYDRFQLYDMFGSFGENLYDRCRGIDQRPVKTEHTRKSLSVEHTYPRDLGDLKACVQELPQLYRNFEKRKARSLERYCIEKAFVKVKFNDFSTTTIERRADEPTLQAYESLLTEAFHRADRPVRLLGVGVRLKEKFNPVEARQLDLFRVTPATNRD